MIAAATTSSVSLDRLPVGWFDFALIALIGLGYFRGRKNGMTKEVLPMFQWLAIVLLGGLAYEMAGQLFIDFARLKITAAYIFGYLALAFLVFLLFIVLKKMLTPRLTGSNCFGSMEYYLGTISGVVRFVCMLFFALALLHAPFYTPAEIAARTTYNARWYGGGMKGYSGNYFPTVQGVQESVFNASFTGSLIAKYLGVLLINTESVNPVKPTAKTSGIRIGN
ncbi:MAG: CvpA family protein [Verrucomicrobiales bacterium]|nr:CvpA family protein [Verrucomicrobiales bacterium]